ncbi:DUF507 family protein [bacterium]|nr:DUF507 family protein [bacterium]
MKLSSGKINHLTKQIRDSLDKNESIEIFDDNDTLRSLIKNEIVAELKNEEILEEQVKNKLNTYSRKIQEGSREWDILFAKELEEMIRVRLQKMLGVTTLE